MRRMRLRGDSEYVVRLDGVGRRYAAVVAVGVSCGVCSRRG
ncbi:hypothetical protein ABT039_03905 [Streptomyces lasiicapitis]